MDHGFDIDGYQIDELIGIGRTGQVWRARDTTTGAEVAIKEIPDVGAVVAGRLRRAAALFADAAGAHAVAVREVAVVAGGVCVVMDRAAGGSLAALLAARGRLHPAEVVTVLAPLAEALAAAHARGAAHGRITPTNVLFSAEGRPLLADFGVAAALAGSEGAPDPASDVYALAAVGRAALTGRSPAATGADLADAAPWVPPALAAEIAAALSADSSLRPDAARFAAGLLRACAASPVRLDAPAARTVDTAPTTTGPTTRRTFPRGLLVAGLVIVGVVAAVLAGIGSTHLSRRSAASLPATAQQVTVTSPSPRHDHSLAYLDAIKAAKWRRIVTRLDNARARAFSRGDPELLRHVYFFGTRGLAADRRLVEVLARRGLRARGFTLTVKSVSLLWISGGRGRARVRVVDVPSGYAVVDRSGHVVAKHPAKPPQTYILRLIKEPGGWVVGRVHPA